MRIVRLNQLRDIDASFLDIPANTTVVLTPSLGYAFRVWDDELEALEQAGYIVTRAPGDIGTGRLLTRHGMRLFSEMNRRAAALANDRVVEALR